MLKRFYKFFILLTVCSSAAVTEASVTNQAEAQAPTNSMPHSFYNASATELKAKFKTPPETVKPWVYWYWINDHISKEGIEKDLAAMRRVGISTALIGIIHLDPNNGSYGKVTALSDEWWQHLHFAIEKAAEYNIDIGLFNSPGWSQSGGPWVTLEQSMRYLDSKEYQVNVKSNVSIISLSKPDGFSQDVKVIAFKTPSQENIRLKSDNTQVTVEYMGSTDNQAQALIDGDLNQVYHFPTEVFKHKEQALTIDFLAENSLKARTLEIFPHNTFSAQATLYAKNEHGEFDVVKSFSMQRPRNMASIGPEHDAPIVVNLAITNAKEFRLILSNFNLAGGGKDESPGIKELVLSSAYKLERYVEKKLAKVHPTPQPNYDTYQWSLPEPTDDRDLLLNTKDVLDISHLVKNHQLHWKAPEGNWTIVHYYMRNTGTQNTPSSKNARGPEIDKLSKKIAQFHFDAYVGKVLKTMKPEQRRALKYVVVDSYEQGAQNWTDDFAERFKQKYSYDPIPFLPAYTGRVVNSPEQSERFLWDVRRMVADSVSYQYTAGLRERARQNGLKLWLENYGHWGFPGEFLQYGGQADIVSGEFWATGNLGAIELKAASSAAHIYGHKTVMSESFTAGRNDAFSNHPWNFKKRGDWSFVEGVNHTLLHVYIHQAYDNRFPGVNAWFGSEFNRNNTWFDYMGSWLDYIKRANYMMQQGKYVADLMYFIGEDAPKMTGEINPEVPAGYSYDFINAEVILQRLTFADGYYQLPDGMRFKLLVLPNIKTMRPAVINKIAQLVKQGGAVYGPKPTRSPSLENYPESDTQVQQLANKLWQNIDGQKITQARYGKGHVFYQQGFDGKNVDLSLLLNKLNTPADLIGLPPEVIWSHRSSDTHDIYFIANQSDQRVSINPSFRMTESSGALKYLQPQGFDAVNGNVYEIAQFKITDARVEVPMQLNGLESSFIVFEKRPSMQVVKTDKTYINKIQLKGETIWLPTIFDPKGHRELQIDQNGTYELTNRDGSTQTVDVNDLPESITLNQPWQLTFEENRDVATHLTLNQLVSLTELSQRALQNYSGTIKYQTTFDVSQEMLRDDQLLQLDLGDVGVIARVILNGKYLGELWSRPMIVGIQDAVHVGSNNLIIEVATTWRNRVIGDLKYPEKFPESKTIKSFHTDFTFSLKISPNDALQESGLMGPVRIKAIRKVGF